MEPLVQLTLAQSLGRAHSALPNAPVVPEPDRPARGPARRTAAAGILRRLADWVEPAWPAVDGCR